MKTGLFAEMRAGVTPRAAGLTLAVLGIQLAFIASYVGAFHHPQPHRIAIAVVYPGLADQLVRQLNGLPGEPLDARAVADEVTAQRQIDHRELYGALIVTGQQAGADRLLVAGAAGSSVAQALAQVVAAAEQARGRTIVAEDVRPVLLGDARGLSGFYLALGWVVGGYLVAIALSATQGARSANRQRAAIRLCALLVYAVLSGIGGAFLVQSVLGAMSGSFVQLCWFGSLLVFATGAFTMALQAVFGFLGVGLAVLLFVVLGNPSAGGAYPAPLLPPFWRAIGPWLPPGAGTDAIRGIAYFHGSGVRHAALLLAAYALLGAIGSLIASVLQEPRPVRLRDLRALGDPRKPRDLGHIL